MKRNVFYLLTAIICFAGCNQNSPDSAKYVDLGLSSGVYWCSEDEPGMYNYDEAVSKFGDNLPSVEQYKELIQECRWMYKKGSGYVVTGPNGKSIKFYFNGMDGTGSGSADGVGQLGMYWTNKKQDALSAYSLSMDFDGVKVQSFFLSIRESVKLVKQPWEMEEEKDEDKDKDKDKDGDDDTGTGSNAVDLGLPSKTKWYSQNEKKYTEYFASSEITNEYDGKIPAKADWQELMDYCTWTWTGKGYKVVGGNGKSIILPAAGYKSGASIVNENEDGYYWMISGNSSLLHFTKDNVGYTTSSGTNIRYSLRLVERTGNVNPGGTGTGTGTGNEDTDYSWDGFDPLNPNISYTFNDKTGTLTITGQGDMRNNSISSPWEEYGDDVKRVIISEGITTIAHHAFKDLQKLQEISIPKSVTRIGQYAFERCYKLNYVELPSGMKQIRNNAFKDCTDLTDLTCLATTPPTVESTSAFPSGNYNQTHLYVPQSALSAYRQHAIWGKFSNISAK